MSPRDPLNLASTTPVAPEVSKSVVSHPLQATATMCYHCFDVLIEELKSGQRQNASSRGALFQNYPLCSSGGDGETSPPAFIETLPHGEVECPLFITWDKRANTRGARLLHLSTSSGEVSDANRSHFDLRGCIGSLSPKPLVPSIGEYALLSALRDRRFEPVSLPELPHLRVAVSLLIQYEECQHCHDWTVGVHGIMIRWCDGEGDSRKRGEYSATYLPEVAVDQGWDQVATIQSLIRKAGYQGRISAELLGKLQCTRYQSSKHRATFDDYVEYRQVDPAVILSFSPGDRATDWDDQRKRRRLATPPGNHCLIM